MNAIDNKLHSLDKIKREIIKQIQDNNQKVTDFKIEILDHISKQQSSQSINDFANTGIDSSNHFDFSTSAKEQIKHQLDAPSYNPVAVAERVPQFVERYNLDKSTLFNEAIAKVVTTEASINKRRIGG